MVAGERDYKGAGNNVQAGTLVLTQHLKDQRAIDRVGRRRNARIDRPRHVAAGHCGYARGPGDGARGRLLCEHHKLHHGAAGQRQLPGLVVVVVNAAAARHDLLCSGNDKHGRRLYVNDGGGRHSPGVGADCGAGGVLVGQRRHAAAVNRAHDDGRPEQLPAPSVHGVAVVPIRA